MEQLKAIASRMRRRPLMLVAIAAVGLAALVLLRQEPGAPAAQQADPEMLLLQPGSPVAWEAQGQQGSLSDTTAQATPSAEPIVVYVSGAVNSPGVYQLGRGARSEDAIRAAGGPADSAALTRINLAARARDEQHIHVPQVGEPLTSAAESLTPRADQGSIATTNNTKLDINAASAEELSALPRLGAAIAQRIVEYRSANGPFTRPEDLMQVKGIGPAIFAAIEDMVTTAQ